MSKQIWNHFAGCFGVFNVLPIALARDDVETELPAGVVGKVPSVFNTVGQIVGFKGWQKGRAKPSDVERWASDARYGFGIRLGFPLPDLGGCVAVCVDVDTENPHYQERVNELICKHVGVSSVPQRVRTNSNRRAYVLAVMPRDGEQIAKRVLRLPAGANGKQEAVELLAHGQQFAAFGRHPSGADLEWLDGPADDVRSNDYLPEPALLTMTADEFDALVTEIADALPITQDTAKAARKRGGSTPGQPVKSDPVALYLDANGWTLSIGGEGQRNIRSPFESEYTNEQGSGDTSVTYFCAGTRDYEQGHFVSLHASDAARTDSDFLDAVGYVASQFDSLPVEAGAAPSPAPRLARDKNGLIEPDVVTVLTALKASEWLGHDVRYDSFAGELVIGGPGAWRSFRDTDYTWLRVALQQKGFKPVSRELVRDAVQAAAEVRTIDTAQEWLNGLKWDGVERIDSFFPNYFGTADSEYTRAASAYVWTAQAGRILSPGCKADMMPILIGDQGCGKSTGVAAIAPHSNYFVELAFTDSDADLKRKIRGILVAEFGEMVGMRKKEAEAYKAFLSSPTDKMVEKYQTHRTSYDRRVIFYGTSNNVEQLDDPTGARRFIPMECGQVNVSAIKQDCPQLWAEATHRYKRDGISYIYVQKLATQEHGHYRASDEMERGLNDWLNEVDELDGSTPAQRGNITTEAVIRAMKLAGWRIDLDRAGQMRAGKALKALGYERRRKSFNNCLAWVYEKPEQKPI